MAQGYHITDILQDVVIKVSQNLNKTVHFQFGHPLEIIENLKRMTGNTGNVDVKYPLIALFHDFKEKRGRVNHIEYEADFRFIIATVTDPNYLANERIENSFKPILYPIYDSFIDEIMLSNYFESAYNSVKYHDKWDRMYWGRNPIYNQKENLFSDYIDAIELENFNLKILKKTC